MQRQIGEKRGQSAHSGVFRADETEAIPVKTTVSLIRELKDIKKRVNKLAQFWGSAGCDVVMARISISGLSASAETVHAL